MNTPADFNATLLTKAWGEINVAYTPALDSFFSSRIVRGLIDKVYVSVKRLAVARGRKDECPVRIHYGLLCRRRSVSNCFFIHWMKNAFEKCVKKNTLPNAERKQKDQLRQIPSLLAIMILPFLFASMPVHAAGSSDKKDSITTAQSSSRKVPAGKAARELVVSEKKGLLSLKAVNIELAQILAALSKASGVPIKMLDQASTENKISLSFQNKTIQEAVREVISILPAGGFAYTSGDIGTKQAIYVITKKGAESLKILAQKMIDRINKGDKPTPIEIREWLINVAAVDFIIKPQGTSMFIVPVLLLLDRDFVTYEEAVLSIFKDESVIRPLRSAMLELIGRRHWDYPGARNSLLLVFDRPTDDPVLQGQISLTLAGRGEKIGDKVIERYGDVSPDARFYYAQTLAVLGRADAVELLREDAMQTQSMPLRSASIGALIKLDPTSEKTNYLIKSVISSAKPVSITERSINDLDNERIAMHAIEAIGKYGGVETIKKLLIIAGDESVAVDVRLTALESLAPKVREMNTTEMAKLRDQLVSLSDQVIKSGQLSEMNQERMAYRINMLKNLLILKGGK